MKHPKRDEQLPLKPVGLALAAVVAGLGAGGAQAEAAQRTPLEPSARMQAYVADQSTEEDADMIVGPSEPVAPFGE